MGGSKMHIVIRDKDELHEGERSGSDSNKHRNLFFCLWKTWAIWIAVSPADCELLENGKSAPFQDGIDQH